jgi:ABC-type glycerol-3-phosphate transport system permease component
MATDTPDTAAEFRRNESWLFDSRTGNVIRQAGLIITGLLIGIFLLLPLYWMVVTALKTTAEIQQIPPTVFPVDPSITGFISVIASSLQTAGWDTFFENLLGIEISSAIDINILGNIYSSLVVAVGAGVIAVLFGSVAAYILSRREFWGKNGIMAVLLASLMFPGTAIMVPEWELFSTLGLFNSKVGITLLYGAMTAPFVVWLMKGFFDDFPTSIIDAAKIDQCTPYETFRYVLVPMARNSLIASFLFAFLLAWNELVFALTLLSQENFTVPPGLLTFVQGFNTQWNVVAAASIIISIPALLGLVYIQRYFVQGLTGGAVKG